MSEPASSAQVEKPTIGTQPANQSVVTGSSATFAVIAAGGGTLVYQWKKNGTDISGASSSIYTTPATSSADNGAVFTVVVTNSAGTASSNAARLTVTTEAVKPAISKQPENQAVPLGQTATFSVIATGTGELHYQWQKFGADIAGATSSSYTTPVTPIFDNGALYSVVVTDSTGNTVTSSTATLVLSKYSLVVKPGGGTYDITECVKDNKTGLIWEGKTASPGSTSRLGTSTYTNFDNKNAAQHFAGTGYPTQDEIDDSTNSIGYITRVNAGSGLCGYTDWRLPTKVELLGIRDADQTSAPQIDKTWFPNTQDGSYWTSSPAGSDPSTATVIYFTSAYISGGGSRSTLYHHVRLVRGNL